MTHVDLDRRTPLLKNHVFEAHHPFDPTSDFMHVWRDNDDSGVLVNFIEDRGGPDELYVKRTMWLDADQCEEFGQALLTAAKLIRAAAG